LHDDEKEEAEKEKGKSGFEKSKEKRWIQVRTPALSPYISFSYSFPHPSFLHRWRRKVEK